MEFLEQELQTGLFEEMLDSTGVGTIVTDPSLDDNPIIYTNTVFLEMTGYAKDEVIGRNCRFLQGEATDPRDVEKIREALKSEKELELTLKNYRKDGTPFWNRLVIHPVRIAGRRYFIGTQTDVSIERTQQQELLANEQEIERLMLPFLSIEEGVAAVALVGTMDAQRYETLKVKICEYVKEQRIEHVLVDITGLTWQGDPPLYWMAQIRDALRIMGSELCITGISPRAAQEFMTEGGREADFHTYASIGKAIEAVRLKLAEKTSG